VYTYSVKNNLAGEDYLTGHPAAAARPDLKVNRFLFSMGVKIPLLKWSSSIKGLLISFTICSGGGDIGIIPTSHVLSIKLVATRAIKSFSRFCSLEAT
jgi:hypothetical protein